MTGAVGGGMYGSQLTVYGWDRTHRHFLPGCFRAWLVSLNFGSLLPILGVVFYFILGRRRQGRGVLLEQSFGAWLLLSLPFGSFLLSLGLVFCFIVRGRRRGGRGGVLPEQSVLQQEGLLEAQRSQHSAKTILAICVIIIIMSLYTTNILILTLFTLVFLVVSVGSSEDDEERLSSRAYWGRR